MADYNIYIHTVSTGGESSPTTPWQLRPSDQASGEVGEVVSGGEFSPSTAVRQAGAFLTNPDSAISTVLHSTVAKVGLVAFAVTTALKIADKALTEYSNAQSTLGGQGNLEKNISNFKTTLHNALTPFSMTMSVFRGSQKLWVENTRNEQQRQLLGGTLTNSPYGRYL